MDHKDENTKLKAELAKAKADLETAKATGPASDVPRVTVVDHATEAAERLHARNSDKRAKLKAETAKEGGDALYYIPEGGSKFYRLGVVYEPGSVVRLPLDEDPSVTWEVVERIPAPPLEPSQVATAPGAGKPPEAPPKRPSEREI